MTVKSNAHEFCRNYENIESNKSNTKIGGKVN